MTEHLSKTYYNKRQVYDSPASCHASHLPRLITSLDTDPMNVEAESKHADTLEGMRRALLRRPDWLGIAASRPLKIHFPLQRSQLTRRRNLNEEDEARWQQHRRHQAAHEARLPFDKERRLSARRGALLQHDADDISVRFGPDIHGTQPVVAFEGGQRHAISDRDSELGTIPL